MTTQVLPGDGYHRGYVSIAALVVHPGRDRFLLGRRRSSEVFNAGYWCFPSRRVKEGEDITSTLADVVKRQTNLEPRIETSMYLSSIQFHRDDYPVVQVVFGLVAGGTPATHEVMDILEWTDQRKLSALREDWYCDEMLKTVQTAFVRGLLVDKSV